MIIAALVGYCLVRECIYLYTTHKLVNKIMSRSFHEYQLANKAGKIEKTKVTSVDNTPDEDLGILAI